MNLYTNENEKIEIFPDGGNAGQVLKKTEEGLEWQDPSSDVTVSDNEDGGVDVTVDGDTKTVAKQADVTFLKERITNIEQSGTGSSGSGVSEAMVSSLWAIIQKSAFSTALTESEKNAFKTAWGINSDGSVTPSTPSVSVSVSGSTMTVSGFTASSVSQNGSTLSITGSADTQEQDQVIEEPTDGISISFFTSANVEYTTFDSTATWGKDSNAKTVRIKKVAYLPSSASRTIVVDYGGNEKLYYKRWDSRGWETTPVEISNKTFSGSLSPLNDVYKVYTESESEYIYFAIAKDENDTE